MRVRGSVGVRMVRCLVDYSSGTLLTLCSLANLPFSPRRLPSIHLPRWTQLPAYETATRTGPSHLPLSRNMEARTTVLRAATATDMVLSIASCRRVRTIRTVPLSKRPTSAAPSRSSSLTHSSPFTISRATPVLRTSHTVWLWHGVQDHFTMILIEHEGTLL